MQTRAVVSLNINLDKAYLKFGPQETGSFLGNRFVSTNLFPLDENRGSRTFN